MQRAKRLCADHNPWEGCGDDSGAAHFYAAQVNVDAIVLAVDIVTASDRQSGGKQHRDASGP